MPPEWISSWLPNTELKAAQTQQNYITTSMSPYWPVIQLHIQSSQTPWQWLTHRLIVNEADRLFESKPSDGGTFNMPARSSSAPRRLPVWFLRFGWLPKSKIPCVPFICAPLRNCIVCFQLVTITCSQSITIPAVPVITVDGSQKAPFHNI